MNSLPLSTRIVWDSRSGGRPVPGSALLPRRDRRTADRSPGVPGMGVDDCQDAQFPAGRELVMDEIHCPHIVASHRLLAVLSQLSLHPSFRVLVPQLEAQLVVNPARFFMSIVHPSRRRTHWTRRYPYRTRVSQISLIRLSTAACPARRGLVMVGRGVERRSPPGEAALRA